MDLEHLHKAAEALETNKQAFIDSVMLTGLWKLVQKSRMKGMSGAFGGVVLRTFAMAGRVMVTFESEGGDVTWMARHDDVDEEFKRFYNQQDIDTNPYGLGLHTINTPTEAAVYMMDAVCMEWARLSPSERATRYRDDSKVTIA